MFFSFEIANFKFLSFREEISYKLQNIFSTTIYKTVTSYFYYIYNNGIKNKNVLPLNNE